MAGVNDQMTTSDEMRAELILLEGRRGTLSRKQVLARDQMAGLINKFIGPLLPGQLRFYPGSIYGAMEANGQKVGDPNDYGYYLDPKGYCTWGTGQLVAKRACTAEEAARKVTPEEAQSTFNDSVAEHERYARIWVKDQKLTQAQFDALTSFSFNAGTAARKALCKLVNAGEYEKVVKYLQDFNKNTPKSQGGPALRARRSMEAKAFMGKPLPKPEPTVEVVQKPLI
jgi:GH24 family phage-related lysozyme (muramidase)